MKVVINVIYKGVDDNARRFVERMVTDGVLNAVRAEEGCLGYEYFVSLEDPGCVLLIEHWSDEASLEAHSKSDNMRTIGLLKERYGLTSTIEKFLV